MWGNTREVQGYESTRHNCRWVVVKQEDIDGVTKRSCHTEGLPLTADQYTLPEFPVTPTWQRGDRCCGAWVSHWCIVSSIYGFDKEPVWWRRLRRCRCCHQGFNHVGERTHCSMVRQVFSRAVLNIQVFDSLKREARILRFEKVKPDYRRVRSCPVLKVPPKSSQRMCLYMTVKARYVHPLYLVTAVEFLRDQV